MLYRSINNFEWFGWCLITGADKQLILNKSWIETEALSPLCQCVISRRIILRLLWNIEILSSYYCFNEEKAHQICTESRLSFISKPAPPCLQGKRASSGKHCDLEGAVSLLLEYKDVPLQRLHRSTDFSPQTWDSKWATSRLLFCVLNMTYLECECT